ncbi:MAG: hypothetical protein ACI4B4_06600, partial [Segatella copri]
MAEVDVAGNGVVRVVIPLYQDAFSLPVLSVRFSMPETGLADFTPQQAKTRAVVPDDNAGVDRAIVEVYA